MKFCFIFNASDHAHNQFSPTVGQSGVAIDFDNSGTYDLVFSLPDGSHNMATNVALTDTDFNYSYSSPQSANNQNNWPFGDFPTWLSDFEVTEMYVIY